MARKPRDMSGTARCSDCGVKAVHERGPGTPLVIRHDQDCPNRTWTRRDLLHVCYRASVPQEHWYNRDSAAAQRQLGECYALLKAQCDFIVEKVENETIWVQLIYKGFNWFEGSLDPDEPRDNMMATDTFYLPTLKRLDEVKGKDWY